MGTVAINEALQTAVGYHQTGRLAEAEAIYRQILVQVPAHADALHLLGLLAFQAAHYDVAIDLIGRAVASNPAVAAYHCNLGESYRRAGQPEQALASLRRAIASDPRLFDAQYNLGLVLNSLDRRDEAIAAFQSAIAIKPDFAEAHNTLGVVFYETGRLDMAIAACGRAVAVRPGFAEAYSNLGNALRDRGRIDEAIAALGQAVELRPDLAQIYSNLGNALRDRGRIDEAIAALSRAVELRPDLAQIHSNLGNALKDKGRLNEAIVAYQRAIELKPDFAECYSNLGNALWSQGRLDQAIAACRRAIELRPDNAEAHNNLGNAFKDKGQLDQAIAACRRAIELKPELAEAHCNLGNALKDLWQIDEAVAAYRRAIALRPDHPEVHNSLAGALVLQGDHEEANRAYHRALALRPDAVTTHSNLLLFEQYQSGVTLAGLARSHAEWAQRHAASLGPIGKAPGRDRDPERPLRLGFVSPDLRRHPVGFFLAGVLEHLRPHSFQSVCYYNRAVRDDLSDRLAAAAAEWHDVVGLDDEELAAKIRADRIDILFDLAGHTSGHRLLVFARRPAPIQASWIGYVGTTGLTAMDYLIADRFHVPLGAEVHYCETVLRMPDGYVCFDPPAEAPAVGPLPAFERGHVTFGSFNNLAKLTPEVVALWVQIVRRVPGSRLLLVSPALDGAIVARRVADAFVAAGADRGQLELRGTQRRHDLLAAYNTVDLALDPFPYSGGVTTCEALWMGVPVITCPGETFASRHSLSHLSNVGLAETVAGDAREYVELAVRLAGNLPHLAALRVGLRAQMACSPLCDGARFADNLTALLREVWRQWCRA